MLEKKKMLGEGPCLGEKVAEREEDFVLPEEQGDAGPGTAALSPPGGRAASMAPPVLWQGGEIREQSNSCSLQFSLKAANGLV